MGLVVAEAVLLGVLGGAVGLIATGVLFWTINHATSQTFLGFSGIELPFRVALLGFTVALLIGLGAGFLPAWGAYRAKVTDMLRAV
jgi:ABC-type antimicrobial peptide transport system permease subunit